MCIVYFVCISNNATQSFFCKQCWYKFLISNSKSVCISKVWCCTYLDNSAREIIIQGCGGMWIFEVIFTLVCHFLSFVQKYNLYVWGTKENLELCLPESDLTIGWWWLLMAQRGCKLLGISFLSLTNNQPFNL